MCTCPGTSRSFSSSLAGTCWVSRPTWLVICTWPISPLALVATRASRFVWAWPYLVLFEDIHTHPYIFYIYPPSRACIYLAGIVKFLLSWCVFTHWKCVTGANKLALLQLRRRYPGASAAVPQMHPAGLSLVLAELTRSAKSGDSDLNGRSSSQRKSSMAA